MWYLTGCCCSLGIAKHSVRSTSEWKHVNLSLQHHSFSMGSNRRMFLCSKILFELRLKLHLVQVQHHMNISILIIVIIFSIFLIFHIGWNKLMKSYAEHVCYILWFCDEFYFIWDHQVEVSKVWAYNMALSFHFHIAYLELCNTWLIIYNLYQTVHSSYFILNTLPASVC